ncbi:MAG TPA: hypothetical protein PLM75_10515, partial [bacterium]|nr:hypothetical protein [bacterium]
EKLNNLIVKAQNELAKIIKKIENQEFLEKAPKAVIEKEQKKKSEYETLINDYKAALNKLK